MAGERGPDRAVVVLEQAGAALVVGVGLVLVLEHRDRPARRLRVHGLGVPVGALHQPHGDRPAARRRPGDQVGEVVAAVAQVGLDDDAGVEVGELVLAEQVPEQPEREVLGVGVLHVEVDGGASVAGEAEQGPQPLRGLTEALLAREGLVVGGERGGLDAHVHPWDRAEVVPLEVVVRRPAGGRVAQGGEHVVDPGRVAVGVGADDRLLAQQVDGGRAPLPPELVEALDRFGRRRSRR